MNISIVGIIIITSVLVVLPYVGRYIRLDTQGRSSNGRYKKRTSKGKKKTSYKRAKKRSIPVVTKRLVPVYEYGVITSYLSLKARY